MKKFVKPCCEVVLFNGNVITSSACGCFDEDLGVLPKNCVGDVGYCACTVNHSPAQDNCTDCNIWDGN
jgi:hypothetical protein